MLSSGLKEGNKTVAHAAVGLTAVLTLMTGNLLAKTIAPSKKYKNKFTPDVRNRRATIFGMMTVTGLAAVGVYVAGFVQKRKQRQA